MDSQKAKKYNIFETNVNCMLLGYKFKISKYVFSCFIFTAECAEGSDTISVDGSTKPEKFEFSIVDGIKDSPKNDEIENDLTSNNPEKKDVVTISFENLKPETNSAPLTLILEHSKLV